MASWLGIYSSPICRQYDKENKRKREIAICSGSGGIRMFIKTYQARALHLIIIKNRLLIRTISFKNLSELFLHWFTTANE